MAKKESELYFPDNAASFLRSKANWYTERIHEMNIALTVQIQGEELTTSDRTRMATKINEYTADAKYWNKRASAYKPKF